MTGRMRFPANALMVAGVVLTALIGLALFPGCRREEPHDHASHTYAHPPAATSRTQAQTVTAEQTTCPVMGGAINKEIFVEYRGKKVYFCCKGCDQTFQQNPEKYLAKLPQFRN